MTILVFANGILPDVSWIRPFLADSPIIIAADGGFKHVRRLHLFPNVVIGDMDSLPPIVLDDPELEDTEFIKFSTDKDETDLEIALQFAASKFEGEILVIGALGGRIDQTLANMLSLTHPHLRDRHIEILEENQRAWLCQPETIIKGQVGDLVSLIPLRGNVHITKTKGLKWPLLNETLLFGHTRGVSNEMTAQVATVHKLDGDLLCVYQSKKSYLAE